MTHLYWKSIGSGKTNLILIHGWGLNSKIFEVLTQSKLNKYFKFHLVDLPGFGNSKQLKFITLKDTVKLLSSYIPDNSIILGWSMGGIIASQLGLNYPNKIKGIISVSSSPCFIEKYNWPGISKKIFLNFYNQLNSDFNKTISNFIICQTTNSSNHIVLKNLTQSILTLPHPSKTTLKTTLKIIFKSDLRQDIKKLQIPMLRIYGSLDTFVPKQISAILDKKWPNTTSVIIEKSAHTPFISHFKDFFISVINFKNYLNF